MVIFDIANVVIISISLLGLWWIYTNKYQEYQVDLTRQYLFMLRDKLFDFAKDGNLHFESKAYGLCRKTINGMIRYCHRLNWLQLVIYLLVIRRSAKYLEKEYIEMKAAANSDLNEEQLKFVNRIYNDLMYLIFDHIIRHSIFLFIAFRIARSILKMLNQFDQARTLFFSSIGWVVTAIERRAKDVGNRNGGSESSFNWA